MKHPFFAIIPSYTLRFIFMGEMDLFENLKTKEKTKNKIYQKRIVT